MSLVWVLPLLAQPCMQAGTKNSVLSSSSFVKSVDSIFFFFFNRTVVYLQRNRVCGMDSSHARFQSPCELSPVPSSFHLASRSCLSG